ncbi:MAG: hypothetical protein VXV85_08135, partial [Candidatus Thermoplasmatota archaeon]|nr:hypothetical protein [Candidatus Thermoplasmatota archaeon]
MCVRERERERERERDEKYIQHINAGFIDLLITNLITNELSKGNTIDITVHVLKSLHELTCISAFFQRVDDLENTKLLIDLLL